MTDYKLAKNVADCFEGFNHLTEHYAMATAHFQESCTADVEELLASIRANEQLYPIEFEQRLNLKMNALVANNAEKYYRTSFKSDANSWNVRDEHMVEAINEIRKFKGENAKVIVWEHNTHIGDARATTMKDRWNGQCRAINSRAKSQRRCLCNWIWHPSWNRDCCESMGRPI